jgi:hypothetical protein
MDHYNQNDFRSVRLRIGILLLALTSAKISEILMLRVGCLRVLEKEFLIEIGHQNIFIRNSKAREMISLREKDFKYFYSIKNDKDLIFTSDFNLTSQTSISRETFTRSTNKALNFVGKSLTPAITLTSNSLIKWNIEI